MTKYMTGKITATQNNASILLLSQTEHDQPSLLK